MNKKEIATTFLQLAASGAVREAYDKFIHAGFKHHNPYFKGDAESLRKGMEEAHAQTPNEFLEVKHTFENEDSVAVHSHVRQTNGNDIAVVHIFRFEDDKIIELWDVGMLIPKDSPNKNGSF